MTKTTKQECITTNQAENALMMLRITIKAGIKNKDWEQFNDLLERFIEQSTQFLKENEELKKKIGKIDRLLEEDVFGKPSDACDKTWNAAIYIVKQLLQDN